ncbi:MAG TPA: sugar transferase [Anaerolineales bacterium]|nr:sugar transferase [Anaerolineales bacterium]
MSSLELLNRSADSLFIAAKRALDVAGAFVLLVILAPVLLLVLLVIKLDSRGPVLFRQPRLGFRGQRFLILKFRTMYAGAESDIEDLLSGDPAQRMAWEQFQKLWNDPRLTRAGKYLRKFSLDELPQLWNVLKGEMSLVGPRPITPEQRELYGPRFDLYISMKPGITGLWQVNGRNLTSFRERVLWDADYIRNWTLGLDLSILYHTIGAILGGQGAY